jgi:hypothetical protein
MDRPDPPSPSPTLNTKSRNAQQEPWDPQLLIFKLFYVVYLKCSKADPSNASDLVCVFRLSAFWCLYFRARQRL